MPLSHRIRIEANAAQRDYFARAAGTARRVWNWALALKKQFNAIKYVHPDWQDQDGQPWLRTIHRDAHAQPFTHLARAFARYFSAIQARAPSHAPRFKRKGRCRDSFYVANDKFRIEGKAAVLPKVGRVDLAEALRTLKAALVDVLKIVTAFTLAHSLTLTLAALGALSLPSRLVESAIAASVILAALNNLWPLVHRWRALVAFTFGLIHGFGFASVLADLGLPRGALVLSLVGFNVGVELGSWRSSPCSCHWPMRCGAGCSTGAWYWPAARP
jgi:hypothetical protein